MPTVIVEGKEIHLPEEIVAAGDRAIRNALAPAFPAIENADIVYEPQKPGAPAIVRVSPRATSKGGTKDNPGKFDCYGKAAPDVVEEANIGRQLFCPAEVGQPKAECLARRYRQAWGLNVSSYVGKYEQSLLLGGEMTVLVGYVDNAAARRDLHETLAQNEGPLDPRFWWVDCGNLFDSGRVSIGSAYDAEQLRGAFHQDKWYALPSPGLQSPGLLKDQPEDVAAQEMSCAELALRNLRSLNINARIAAEASDFITRLLVTRDLKRLACQVNVAAGSMTSTYTDSGGSSAGVEENRGILDRKRSKSVRSNSRGLHKQARTVASRGGDVGSKPHYPCSAVPLNVRIDGGLP